MAWHSSGSDPYYTGEAAARGGYYGMNAYPTLRMDGTNELRGAYPDYEQQYNWYMAYYNYCKSINSPVNMTFLSYSQGNGKASVKVKLTLEDNLASGHVCNFVLWETGLTYNGRDFRYVERRFEQRNVTIMTTNQTQEIGVEFTLDGGWVTSNLGVSVFVQNPSDYVMAQGRAHMLVSGVNVSPASLGRVKAMFK